MRAVRAIPTHTLCTVALCCALQLGVYVVGFQLQRYTISAALVLPPSWQVWRLVTASYFHVGLLHIAMNMMSLVQLGSSTERLFGTATLTVATAWIVVLGNVLYVAVCCILAYGLRDASWLHYNSVGYSGVIFALAVFETFLNGRPSVRVFGMFSVPTKLYPWVLLVAISLVMPGE